MTGLDDYAALWQGHSALLLGTAALVVASAAVAVFGRRKPWTARIVRKALLTPNETEFFHRLERALPAYRVFSQVSFAALVTDDGKLSQGARWSFRARFDRKIVDFVVCDGRTLRVVALIELDDRTHLASADRQRDAITKAAAYQTFRLSSRLKPSIAEIAALFEHERARASA